ncbi:unnamed protein product [Paramecium primaurelia]|uniref:Uncharacterized protein n=1 Tax=Paramecium primaurelia TaxID=5886 RepID=A0A8S1MK46_PARPR|nr:unnamed protein product [Paramecium primaurelia]
MWSRDMSQFPILTFLRTHSYFQLSEIIPMAPQDGEFYQFKLLQDIAHHIVNCVKYHLNVRLVSLDIFIIEVVAALVVAQALIKF